MCKKNYCESKFWFFFSIQRLQINEIKTYKKRKLSNIFKVLLGFSSKYKVKYGFEIYFKGTSDFSSYLRECFKFLASLI